MKPWQEVLQALDRPRSAIELAARIGTTVPLARAAADRVVRHGGATLTGVTYSITACGRAYLREMLAQDVIGDLGVPRPSADEVVACARERAVCSVWVLVAA